MNPDAQEFYYRIVEKSGFSDFALNLIRGFFLCGYAIQKSDDHRCVVGRQVNGWDPVTRKPQKLKFISINKAGETKKWIEFILQNGEMLR